MYSLGIELSTQSTKTVILDLLNREVIHADSFEYDIAFPEYETEGGVLKSDYDDIRHTSPFMLVEALDLAFNRLKKKGIDMSRILALKCDAMQHCTVYTDNAFHAGILSLDSGAALINQLGGCITRKTSPIWEDRSTAHEAASLTESMKTKGGICSLTGNRAELRFPAAQILKWAGERPDEYRQTGHIFLLSAFITSILAGKIAPVDTGDGWGTNLNSLDLSPPKWSNEALSVMNTALATTGIDSPLESKIGRIDHYDAKVGTINPYFSEKFGLPAEAILLAGTGDNPATLLGCGGQAVISLGSSYTISGVMDAVVPSLKEEYNVFGYTKGRAMALCVFTNGSKVHDHFLKKYLLNNNKGLPKKEDWQEYMKAGGEARLSPDENLMLPFLFDESLPLREKGIVRDGFSEEDMKANIRALHVSQVLSLRAHSAHLKDVERICVVGGGSANPLMMQLIADIFRASVYSTRNAGLAAPMGCAISGARHLLDMSYDEAAENFVEKENSISTEPFDYGSEVVSHLLDKYSAFEKRI